VANYSGLGANHSRIFDRWAADTGRLEGASAEEAVPFPVAVDDSLFVGTIDDQVSLVVARPWFGG
jgi:hypothetical protein